MRPESSNCMCYPAFGNMVLYLFPNVDNEWIVTLRRVTNMASNLIFMRIENGISCTDLQFTSVFMFYKL